MPFLAVGLQVLVSSPSDTVESRKTITTAIGEWNDLNAVPLSVMLLPRLWEISAVGGFGSAPQRILNEQLVDSADIVIAVLWTRLGTPTDSAGSGTVEEIERAIARGTDVLLYFSEAPVHPATVDSPELEAVREFRDAMKSRGLYAVYESEAALKGRVTRDLTRLVHNRSERGQLHPTSGPSRSQEPASDGLAEQLDRYRSELRGLIAQIQLYWIPLRENSDSDGIRRLAAAMAQEISKYLSAVAGLGEDQSASELYSRLLQLGQKASQLSRMQMYLDGGRSWNALNTGVEEVLDGLMGLVGTDWKNLLLTDNGPN